MFCSQTIYDVGVEADELKMRFGFRDVFLMPCVVRTSKIIIDQGKLSSAVFDACRSVPGTYTDSCTVPALIHVRTAHVLSLNPQ